MSEAQSKSSSAPTLTLPRERGREQAECAASAEEDLTARVRALYENSAVPVREIARLAGVTERTIYKYARKGGWKARYAWIDPGGIKGRQWRAAGEAAPGKFVPAKGAGGRFIRREDMGKAFARGLKATDPVDAARAAAACADAEAVAADAQVEAALLQWNETFIDCLGTVRMIGDELAVYRQKRRQWQPGTPMPETHAREQALNRLGHIALDCVECCQVQMAALYPAYLGSIGKS